MDIAKSETFKNFFYFESGFAVFNRKNLDYMCVIFTAPTNSAQCQSEAS